MKWISLCLQKEFVHLICAELLFNLFCRVKTHLRLCELRWNVFGLLPQLRTRTTTTTTRTTVRIRKVIIMTFDCCYLCCMLHSAAGLLSFNCRRRFNILYSCPEQWQKCWPLSASKSFSLHSTWTVDHLKRGLPCSMAGCFFSQDIFVSPWKGPKYLRFFTSFCAIIQISILHCVINKTPECQGDWRVLSKGGSGSWKGGSVGGWRLNYYVVVRHSYFYYCWLGNLSLVFASSSWLFMQRAAR